MKELKEMNGDDIFFMELPDLLCSWHKWAKVVYNHAEQYEHWLFDREGILSLVEELQAEADKLRNGGKICRPDFDLDLGRWCDLGYTAISVMTASGTSEYSIRFIRVNGHRFLSAN